MKRLLFVIAVMLIVTGCGKIPQSEYRYIDTKEIRR